MKFDGHDRGRPQRERLPARRRAGPGRAIEVAVEGPLPEVKVTTDASGHYEFPHILPEGYYTAHRPRPGGRRSRPR